MDYFSIVFLSILFGLFQRIADDLEHPASVLFGIAWGVVLGYVEYEYTIIGEFYFGILIFWILSKKIDEVSHLLGFIIALAFSINSIKGIAVLIFTYLLYKYKKPLHIYLPPLIFFGEKSFITLLIFSYIASTTAIILKRRKNENDTQKA